MEETINGNSPNNANWDSLDISGTWTVVTDNDITTTKKNPSNLLQQGKNQENIDKEEKLESTGNNKEQHTEKDECQVDSTTNPSTEAKIHEDSSDEISIISECDSTEHLATQINVKDHLQNFHLQFATNNNSNNVKNEVPEVLQTERNAFNNSASKTFIKHLIDRFSEIKSFVDSALSFKKGLHVGFYVGLTLAALIVLSKTYNPYCEKGLSKIDELNRKIDDLNLNNNLIRSEIDLLHKQVKYLLAINEKQQNNRKHRRQNRKWDRDSDKYGDDDDYNQKHKEKQKQKTNDKVNKHKNENHRERNQLGKMNRRRMDEKYKDDELKNSVECSSNELRDEEFCVRAHKPNEWNKQQKSKAYKNKNRDNEFIEKMNETPNKYNDAKRKYKKERDSQSESKKQSQIFEYDCKQTNNFINEANNERSTNYREQPRPKPQQHQAQWQDKMTRENNGEWQMNYMRNRENARQINDNIHKQENWYLKRSNGREDKRYKNHESI